MVPLKAPARLDFIDATLMANVQNAYPMQIVMVYLTPARIVSAFAVKGVLPHAMALQAITVLAENACADLLACAEGMFFRTLRRHTETWLRIALLINVYHLSTMLTTVS